MKSSTRTARDRRRATLLPLACVLALAACRAAPKRPAAPDPEASAPVARTVEIAPSWIGEPVSWAKLEAIETWLAAQDAGSDRYWVIEGELQLAQGRLELARHDQGQEKSTTAAIAARVRTARAGLERVIANEEASAGQKKRAQAALVRADRLAKPAVAASSPLGVKVIPRGSWGAKPANASRMDKNKGGWKRITVHHSAERNPPELDGSQAASAAAVRSIQKAHVEGRETGYGDIGYHFVVDPYGRVFQGRDLAWQGAHAKGANNVQNIGVCLIGNFDVERPTSAALDALERLLDDLCRQHSIARAQVLGHGDLKSTDCPGRNLEPWVRRYAHASAAKL